MSDWTVPVLGSVHVLCMALFAGGVLVDSRSLRRFRWVGLALMILTGALLFAPNPARTYDSWSFRCKLAVLAALAFVRGPRWLVCSLWAVVIFASRGIAYF